jgi:hypothetical protein
MLRRHLVLVPALALAACIPLPTPASRLSESASEFNDAARFGRLDIASEHVREIAREEFSKKHARWGKQIRVVDLEMTGMRMRKDGDADVFISVTWQRPDETTMRSTEVAQRWTSTRGSWAIISEEERAGDKGLLSEVEQPKADEAAPPAPPARSRWQTRVIYEQ